MGETQSARALAEDTLERSRRALGSDHPITLYLTQDAGIGHLVLGDDAVGDHHSRPL
ncbi:tetratricopeptide repeat protein [Geodermatophilus sp. URMC 60]